MEDDALLGQMTREYSTNEAEIDRIRKELRELGLAFSELGRNLSERNGYEWERQLVKDVSVSGGVLHTNRYGRSGGIPLDAVERTSELVETLSRALDKKRLLEEALKSNGLESIIRPLRR